MKYRVTNVHDQIMHGAIAGIIGAIVQSAFALIAKTLHFTDRVFLDYGEVLILGRDVGGMASIIGAAAHLMNAAVWGIIFSYIMRFSKKRYYILKGMGLGIFVWLFSLALATLFKLPSFNMIPTSTAYVLLFGAMIWGLTMAFVYRYFDRKIKNDANI